jgi:hypothetical protein
VQEAAPRLILPLAKTVPERRPSRRHVPALTPLKFTLS